MLAHAQQEDEQGNEHDAAAHPEKPGQGAPREACAQARPRFEERSAHWVSLPAVVQ